jgi:hypothetical protein
MRSVRGDLARRERTAQRRSGSSASAWPFSASRRMRCYVPSNTETVSMRPVGQTSLPHKGVALLYSQDSLMNFPSSDGEAKTIDTRSPCIPDPVTTGLPGFGPCLLESVFSRTLYSQTL